MGKARSLSFPAPVGGWNARDSLDQMAPEDAIILDNWLPRSGRCEVRKGYSSHATGLGADVRTLAEYDGAGTKKLLAGANGNIFDATSAGAASSLASGFSEDFWQYTNFDGSTGFVNGTDAPQIYNGSTVGAMTVSGTGLTVTSLINVSSHKSRTYFCEVSSLSFWYSAVNTLGGALTEFPLGRVTNRGGYLMATGTWTRDSGSGPDDVFVAVTSNGEVIVYAGGNPGDASDWSLIGRYQTAPPLGRRCLLNIGGDLIILTKDGYMPMTAIINGLRGSSKATVSDKIRGQVVRDAQSYSGNEGWQAVFYPRGGFALVNVPLVVDATYQQHVVNTSDNPGKWCRFTGIQARCWAVYNDRLYFGGDGVVYLADDGYADNSGNIETDAQTAFNYLNNRTNLKQFQAIQPVLSSDGSLSLSAISAVDFSTPSASYFGSPTSIPSGSQWDVAAWDVASWAGGEAITQEWQSAGGIGRNISLRVKTRTQGQQVSWYATNYLYSVGGLV